MRSKRLSLCGKIFHITQYIWKSIPIISYERFAFAKWAFFSCWWGKWALNMPFSRMKGKKKDLILMGYISFMQWSFQALGLWDISVLTAIPLFLDSYWLHSIFLFHSFILPLPQAKKNKCEKCIYWKRFQTGTGFAESELMRQEAKLSYD